MEINILEVLDRMDEIRRNHYHDKNPTPDLYCRMLEAVLAQAAGYKSRSEWTDKLKEQKTRYTRDLSNPEKWSTF